MLEEFNTEKMKNTGITQPRIMIMVTMLEKLDTKDLAMLLLSNKMSIKTLLTLIENHKSSYILELFLQSNHTKGTNSLTMKSAEWSKNEKYYILTNNNDL